MSLKRVDETLVRKTIRDTIQKYLIDKAWCADTNLKYKLGLESFCSMQVNLEVKLSEITGQEVYFKEGTVDWNGFVERSKQFYLPLRVFEFTPLQQHKWEDGGFELKLLDDLAELIEQSEDDFYGDNYCATPLKNILSKYCDGWK